MAEIAGPIKHFHGGTRSHTAGPWTVGPEDWLISQSSGMGYRNFPVRAPEGFDIAMVYSDEDDDEQAANVRLIAAAPELYAALQEAVRALNTAKRFRVGDTDSYAIAALCDRAIAKAEGRE